MKKEKDENLKYYADNGWESLNLWEDKAGASYLITSSSFSAKVNRRIFKSNRHKNDYPLGELSRRLMGKK